MKKVNKTEKLEKLKLILTGGRKKPKSYGERLKDNAISDLRLYARRINDFTDWLESESVISINELEYLESINDNGDFQLYIDFIKKTHDKEMERLKNGISKT